MTTPLALVLAVCSERLVSPSSPPHRPCAQPPAMYAHEGDSPESFAARIEEAMQVRLDELAKDQALEGSALV